MYVSVTLAWLANALRVLAQNPGPIGTRDGSPTDAQLLDDCPGGPHGKADACTFEVDPTTLTVYSYTTSNVLRNCGAHSQAVQPAFQYTEVVVNSYSLGATASVASGHGIVPDGAIVTPSSAYTANVNVSQVFYEEDMVEPAQQGTLLIQQSFVRHTGRLRVNYGRRLAGHYFRFIDDFNDDVPVQGGTMRAFLQLDCKSSFPALIAKYNADASKRQIA